MLSSGFIGQISCALSTPGPNNVDNEELVPSMSTWMDLRDHSSIAGGSYQPLGA